MTKAALVQHLAAEAGVTRRQAAAMLDALRDRAAKALQDDGEFTIPGVAKLQVAERKARQGRNVQTGEAIAIPARQVVRAKVARPFQTEVVGD